MLHVRVCTADDVQRKVTQWHSSQRLCWTAVWVHQGPDENVRNMKCCFWEWSVAWDLIETTNTDDWGKSEEYLMSQVSIFPHGPVFLCLHISSPQTSNLLTHVPLSPTFSLYLPGLKPNFIASSACWRGTDSAARPLRNYLEITFPFVPRPAELIFQLWGQWEQGCTEWDGWKTEKSKGKEGKWQVAERTQMEQRGQMWSRRWAEETRG